MENISDYPQALLTQTSQIYIYIPYYLYIIINCFSICLFQISDDSTKIKHQLDFYEMIAIYLDMNANVHNVYFDTTKLKG
jgi:hypothetical protein